MATTRLRGCAFSYDVTGDGGSTPLVWGHGLTSSRALEDESGWLDVTGIAAGRRLLRYDARGHGQSGDLNRPEDGDWAELALDQIALIDAHGFDRVMLGGASMGAATALHAALRLGERVEKLLLMIPPTAWATRSQQIELYGQMAAVVEERGVAPLVHSVETLPPPDPFVGDVEYIGKRVASLQAADRQRLAAVFRGAGHADLPPETELPAVTAPTMVLAWSGDTGHPVETADRLGALLPNSEVVIARSAADVAGWTELARAFVAE